MGFSEYYQETRHTNGIYALKKGDDIVYIGSSMDIYTRILEHKADEDKDFDSVSSISTIGKGEDAEVFREVIEMGIICKLKPIHNKIYFDNFVYWILSIPHYKFNISHADFLNKKASEGVSLLNSGGHHEY